ncbi:MAG TPA: hypothetical protein VH988_00510 [Thermoanaerobaculia bacterium]|jgi:hypothetical protein|nr:hypothetical protein [Thermoanaerobaculia bacterium]
MKIVATGMASPEAYQRNLSPASSGSVLQKVHHYQITDAPAGDRHPKEQPKKADKKPDKKKDRKKEEKKD